MSFSRNARVSFLVVAAASLGASVARAQDDTDHVERCLADTDDARQAQRAVRSFGAMLDDSSLAVTELQAQLGDLLEIPCLAAAEEAPMPSFRSRAALRAWWDEGGLDWLWHFAMGRAPGAPVEIVFPPDVRPSLSLETRAADDPLRPLLCGEGDAPCGRATSGWALRAELAFAAHAARERERRREVDATAATPPDAEPIPHDAAGCAAMALGHEASERFERWYGCVSHVRDPSAVLPVGALRAPTRGWLVIRGRRGHYSFCDEVRAYDLASGAAYVARSCSGLVLAPDGSVQGTATDAARQATDVVGRLPVDALREAAWMLLMMGAVDHRHRGSVRVALPEGISPRWEPSGTFGLGGGSSWSTSAQTRLSWTWTDGAHVLARGTLTWPNSYLAAEDHAGDLLEIAEAALAPGCVPATLPRRLEILDGGQGVSGVDADPAALQRTQDALVDRLRALPARRCR